MGARKPSRRLVIHERVVLGVQEIPGLLEGRDHHPEERERGEQVEDRDNGVMCASCGRHAYEGG